MPAKNEVKTVTRTRVQRMYNTNTGKVTATYTTYKPFTGLSRSIVYTSRGRKRFNDCSHYETRVTEPPVTLRLLTPDGKTGSTYQGWFPSADRAWVASRVTDWLTPTGFLGRAYDSMSPKLDNDVNVVNFLLELKDFSSMFKGIGIAARNLAYAISRLPSSLSARVRGAAAGAAEHHLNMSFGILPFARDVQALANSYSAFKQRVNDINGNSGKILYHRYRETSKLPATRQLNWAGLYSGSGRYRYQEAVEVQHNCTVKYRYTVDLPGGIPPTLSNYARSLGFRKSATTIWNAIPFSFLIDWILKVGKWLSRFDEKLPIRLEILDCCLSQRSVEKMRLALENGTPPPTSARWDRDIPRWGEATHTTYLRKQIYPGSLREALSTPRYSNVDLRELKLALALLVKLSNA